MAALTAPFVDDVPVNRDRRALAVACDAGHPHHYHEAARRDTTIREPAHEDPTNYKSREDWQRALVKSGIDPEAKRYIKQLENTVVDGWDRSFDAVWAKIEEAIDRGLPVTDELFIEYLTESARKQLQQVDTDAWTSAFNGLYVRGRDKADLTNGNGRRKAQRVDTLEDQAQLARLRQTALGKVKTITREDLKAEILEALSRPGAAAQNPTAIANEIIRQERKRLEEATEDRKRLREALRDLYDNQRWKIQRITRTESANAYTLSQLIGYQQQGIKRVRWNSNLAEQRTCPLCLSYDGNEYDIAELLAGEGARYPLSNHSHPQCRCWLTPIISHTTLESMEEMYRDDPDQFAPGQTVFDRAVLEMEDVVKEYQTYYGVTLKDTPVEHEDEIKETLDVIRETPYQQFQPTGLAFVKDVGATGEFVEASGLPEPVLGQVTSWLTPDNQLLVSQFSTDDGNTISASVLRAWAAKIYDEDAGVQRVIERLFARDEVRPGSISPKTVDKLLKAVEPFSLMRRQLVDDLPTVALEKRLREAKEPKLRSILEALDIPDRDIDTIAKWRDDRPVWTLDGKFVPAEGATGSFHNRFVNRTAEQGPRDMFVESAAAFVLDPYTLHERDPDLFNFLREEVFAEKDFRKG